MGRILVGVDGSERSRLALEWATEEARFRRCHLDVVVACHMPPGWFSIGDPFGTPAVDTLTPPDITDHAQELADRMVEEIVGHDDSMTVTTRAVLGKAGDVLVRESKKADLLVVGSRGHGDIGSILLGSVGMHTVHHAHCPVVVVRPEEGSDEEASDEEGEGPS